MYFSKVKIVDVMNYAQQLSSIFSSQLLLIQQWLTTMGNLKLKGLFNSQFYKKATWDTVLEISSRHHLYFLAVLVVCFGCSPQQYRLQSMLGGRGVQHLVVKVVGTILPPI